MNWLFRRHFWIVHLVFIGITAAILAKTFSTVVGYWLSKKIPEKPLALASLGRGQDEPVIRNFSSLNERNIFEARREKIVLEDIDEMDGADPGRWQDAGPSGLPLKLVSTMVFLNPYDSRVVVMETSSGKSGVFSLKECQEYRKKHSEEIETVLPEEAWEPERPCNSLFSMATVVRIEDFRIYIFNEREKKFEYLSLLEADKAPIRRRAPVELSEKAEGEGVRKTGATSYEIDQSEFDKALSNVARLMTEARAVPEMDDSGAPIGFKIVYLKDGSLFEKIGIEKMDVLTRINGFELNSPEKALQLFSKLRSASKFTIDLKRGDQSLTLDYSVVR